MHYNQHSNYSGYLYTKKVRDKAARLIQANKPESVIRKHSAICLWKYLVAI